MIITFAGGFFELTEEGDRDFLIWSDEKVKRGDAMNLAIDAYDKALEGIEVPGERSIENPFLQTFMIYRLKEGNTLLTA